MWRYMLFFLGSISLGLGILGVILPLLPTTPFLLLAAACYIRSSEDLYQWLINHPFFGDYIKNYREKRGVPRRAKYIAITLLWVTISYSIFWVIPLFWVKIILFCIAVGVTLHLLSLKSL